MTILPSRRTEFTHLFPRFLDEFLNADVGNQHCRVYRESAAKARENYERVCAKADRGEDYTDDLLRRETDAGCLVHVDVAQVVVEGPAL